MTISEPRRFTFDQRFDGDAPARAHLNGRRYIPVKKQFLKYHLFGMIDVDQLP